MSEIKASPVPMNCAVLQCPFCIGYWELILQDSLGEGLTYVCQKCKKKFLVTNLEPSKPGVL